MPLPALCLSTSLHLNQIQCQLDSSGQSFIWTFMCLPTASVSFIFTSDSIRAWPSFGQLCPQLYSSWTFYVLPETVVAPEWSGSLHDLISTWDISLLVERGLIYLSSRSTYFVILIASPLCRRERNDREDLSTDIPWLNFSLLISTAKRCS